MGVKNWIPAPALIVFYYFVAIFMWWYDGLKRQNEFYSN